MTYEVELKFPLTDPAPVLAKLDELGATRLAAIEQSDLYFAHPIRNFANTDEALRIRSAGISNAVTYKSPIVDDQTKTRREIEIPFADGADSAAQFAEMLTILGFQEVRTVSKKRVPFHLQWEDHCVEVALDDVVGLPGSFIEIEILADEANREAARDSILRLAEHLELKGSERKSYIRLLLDADS